MSVGRAGGATILCIGDAIAVAILRNGAAVRIYLHTRGRVRAAVQRIRHAIVIVVGGATGGVHRALRRVGALVDPVPNAVMIGIDGASIRIDFGAGRGCGALVEQVVHAVVVGIRQSGLRRRTTLRVDLYARWCVGALVDTIEYPVAVRVVRAACRVNRGAGGSVGALVDAVEDAIVVGVGRAAALVDRSAERRVGTGVVLVRDAITIGVVGRDTSAGVRLEERDSRRCNEVRGMLAEGAAGRWGVDAPCLEPERRS